MNDRSGNSTGSFEVKRGGVQDKNSGGPRTGPWGTPQSDHIHRNDTKKSYYYT